MISKSLAEQAGEYALKSIKDAERTSKLTPPSSSGSLKVVPEVSLSDIDIGQIIGTGSFCDVFRVRIRSSSNNPSSNTNLLEEGTQYALKCLNLPRISGTASLTNTSNEAIEDDCCSLTVQAACDIVMEGHVLSRLNHENIVRLQGIAAGCISKSFLNVGQQWNPSVVQGYFILQELLVATLSDRMKEWKSKEPYNRLSQLLNVSKHTKTVDMFDRVKKVAVDITRGMEYLHSKNIILRDLVSLLETNQSHSLNA